MYVDFKKVLTVTALILLGIVIGIFGTKSYLKYKEPKQTITVTGSGEVDAQTDQANISAQVSNTASTQDAAEAANKKDVEALKKKLNELGIPETRITQSSYAQPMYREYSGESQGMMAPDIYPYPTKSLNPTAITNLNITLDSVKNVDKVVATITGHPNTQIQSTYYSLSHRQEWEKKAKEEALKDAREQIEQIAKTNKLKVGKLVYLKDMNEVGIYPVTLEKRMMAPNEAPGMEIQPEEPTNTGVAEDNTYYGEQTVKITASYQARYELY